MDKKIKDKLDATIRQLKEWAVDDIDLDNMDPIARMMLVALEHEAQSIEDYIDSLEERIVERFCSQFIPYREICAMPAIALLEPRFRENRDSESTVVSAGMNFQFKNESIAINYIPIFETLLLPHSDVYTVTDGSQKSKEGFLCEETTGQPDILWVGIATAMEVECIKGLSLLVRGTAGVMPQRVTVGSDGRELDFATMHEMENIGILEPFDAQQAAGQHFAFINAWKDCLLNMKDAALMYVTDPVTDRDLFKKKRPFMFSQRFKADLVGKFSTQTLWLQLEFPKGYVVPKNCQVQANILPVANVDVESVTLNDYQPIKRLDTKEHSFFLSVLQPTNSERRQGLADKVIIRDFDAHRYNNGDLYRDVRTLYNRFIDDYNAFAEYNGIAKDTKVLKELRNTINTLGKSVDLSNERFLYDSGTFAMKNISSTESVGNLSVKYITTKGRLGNTPAAGDIMENKKMPLIDQKVPVVADAMGGTDKAPIDARYEKLRYYALTNDRLYTRMDIDAFLRQQIIDEFGSEEFGERDARRIFIRISVEGAAGDRALRRGLYIDLEFKDKKNYEHAVGKGFDTLMQQRIQNRSCIAMPITVTLRNLEG